MRKNNHNREQSESIRIKVIEMRKQYPCLTLEHIGNQVGLTRERVRQILNKSHLETHRKLKCLSCGVVIKSPYTRWGYCHKCIKITTTCANCGAKIVRSPSEIIGSGNSFCSHSCQGEWQSSEGKLPMVKCDCGCGTKFDMSNKRSKYHFVNREHYHNWIREQYKIGNRLNKKKS